MGKNSARAKETIAREKTAQNAASQQADINKAIIDVKKQKSLKEQQLIQADLASKKLEAGKEQTNTIAMYSVIGLLVLSAMIGLIFYLKNKKK